MARAKKRRAFGETLNALLAEGVRAGEITLKDGELESEGTPRDEAVALAVIKKALAGDIQAVKFIADAASMSVSEAETKQKPFRLTLVVKRPSDEA